MSLCLSMIVRDEAHIIRRCLESVKPFIDSYSISDTGSTDDTMEIIREELAGIPGVLTSDPWEDFATNRNLSLARAKGDYVLTVDADEVLEFSGEPIGINTEIDGFYIKVEIPSGQIWSPRLLRNDPRWKWQFKTHEYPVFDGEAKMAKLDGLSLRGFFDSHQNITGEKGYRVIEILENEPPTARNVLHLAMSLYIMGRNEEAIAKFYDRASMEGDAPDTYTALWLAAELMSKTGQPFDEVAAAFFRAYIFRPGRYEALVCLCELLRTVKKYEEIYKLSSIEPKPSDDLTLMDTRAVWRVLEEHAIAAYYLGKRDEAVRYCRRVLEYDLSPKDRERMVKNLELCSS